MGEWNGDRISFVVMSFVGFGLEPTSRCFYDVGPDGIVNQDWQRHVNKNRGTKLEQHLTQRSRQQQDNNTRQTKRHLESNKLTENNLKLVLSIQKSTSFVSNYRRLNHNHFPIHFLVSNVGILNLYVSTSVS